MEKTEIKDTQVTEEVKEVSESVETTETVTEEKTACDKAEECDAKKETENNQSEEKVTIAQVKAGLEGKKSEAKDITEEQADAEVKSESKPEVMEALLDVAAQKVSDIMEEAMNYAPIEEGVSKEQREANIYEYGQKLLNDVMSILEGIVAGTTMELKGAEVEVKDFVGTGGTVKADAEAGINPPSKSEDDEHEKKVKIKEYPAHESEEIDYKSKYAESEAVMDDLVQMVEKTASQYTSLVEEYNKVVAELQAYKLAEEFPATVQECADLLESFDYEDIREEFIKVVAEENNISEEKKEEAEVTEEKAEDETEEEKAEDEAEVTEEKEDTEEKKEEAEEKKEEKEEKKEEKCEDAPACCDKKEEKCEANESEEETVAEATEEIKESLENVKDVVISEEVEAPARRNKAFSAFGNSSDYKFSSKGKAFSVFRK